MSGPRPIWTSFRAVCGAGCAIGRQACAPAANGLKDNSPLNNNRGNNNNNRRRGRNNNGNGNGNRQGGGGQQINRIDSRARGNAPQLLEKYRKLAHDAHLNGDRVQEEYFLQFADHYFRVLADARVRQEEQRARRDERWQEGGEGTPPREDSDDAGEFGAEAEYTGYEQSPTYSTRREREERGEQPRQDNRSQDSRPQENRSREDRPREDRPRDDRPRDERPREDRKRDRPERNDRAERAERPARVDREAPVAEAAIASQGEGAEEAPNPFEPPENPFVANRGTRGLKPRREDRRRRTQRHSISGR